MKRRTTIATALAFLAMAIPAAGAGRAEPPPPAGFFGIAPQTTLTEADLRYMKAGGVETIRLPVPWSAIQPTKRGGYQWSGLDEAVALAARQGLRVLPDLYSTPRWLGKPTALPTESAVAREAWSTFLSAAVERYGPRGAFWREHATEGVDYEPPIRPALPIRTWQLWNEANFFYFVFPVSPGRYARLVMNSSRAIKGVDPGAKIVLSGLFGKPTAGGSRGMDAADFLAALYRTPGIKSRFDGIALHPYAVDTETLEELVEEFHAVALENHDRPGLYITEMGWGSQNDFQQVAFEQGIQGQVDQLRGAYGYLLENQRRLNVKQVFWYSWKDSPGYTGCNYCDSVGLFRAGPKFKPKPSWHAFVRIAGGSARP